MNCSPSLPADQATMCQGSRASAFLPLNTLFNMVVNSSLVTPWTWPLTWFMGVPNSIYIQTFCRLIILKLCQLVQLLKKYILAEVDIREEESCRLIYSTSVLHGTIKHIKKPWDCWARIFTLLHVLYILYRFWRYALNNCIVTRYDKS